MQDQAAQAAFAAAERLLAQGELLRAVAGFGQSVILAPSNLDYHVRYQDVALTLPATEVGGDSQPAPATRTMRDYYKQLPDDGASPLTPYLQARLQLYDRREEPARLLFEAALHRDQQFYPAQLALGQLWRGVDKLAFAQQWLRKAAANPRARPEAQRALAEVSMEMGLWGDAVRCYEAYFAASPHDFDSKRTYLSLVLYKVPKQLEDAERIVDELLRSQPDDLRLRMDRGAVYWRQGKLEAAATEYRAVLRADPKQARAALNLGNLFYEHGQRAPAGPPRRDALVRARTAYRYYRSLDTTDDAFDWFDFKLAVPVRLQRIAAELGAGGPGPARWQDI